MKQTVRYERHSEKKAADRHSAESRVFRTLLLLIDIWIESTTISVLIKVNSYLTDAAVKLPKH